MHLIQMVRMLINIIKLGILSFICIIVSCSNISPTIMNEKEMVKDESFLGYWCYSTDTIVFDVPVQGKTIFWFKNDNKIVYSVTDKFEITQYFGEWYVYDNRINCIYDKMKIINQEGIYEEDITLNKISDHFQYEVLNGKLTLRDTNGTKVFNRIKEESYTNYISIN